MIYFMGIEDKEYIKCINTEYKKKEDIEILLLNRLDIKGMKCIDFENADLLCEYWFTNVKNEDMTFIDETILHYLLKKRKKRTVNFLSVLTFDKVSHYIIREKSESKYLYSNKMNCVKKMCIYLKKFKINTCNIFLVNHIVNDDAVREANIIKLFSDYGIRNININPINVEKIIEKIFNVKESTGVIFSSEEATLIFLDFIKCMSKYMKEEYCFIDNKIMRIF